MDIKTNKFGVGEIIRTGWQVYSANFTNILMVVLCVYIPINIVLSYIYTGKSVSDGYRLHVDAALFLLIAFIALFFGLITSLATAFIVEKAIQGEKIGWKAALRLGFSRWGSAIGTELLYGIILIGLTLLLVVPGIIWYVYYVFFIFVVALRGIGGKSALDYSKNLVKGQWWRVAGIFLLIMIPTYLTNFIITKAFTFLSTFPIMNFIATTISVVIVALFEVMLVIFFLNTDYLKNPAPVAAVDLVGGAVPETQS